MIPNDREFEVYVCEGVMVEVWRGQHVSVAQQFGVEWDGPTHSVLHSNVFVPPGAAPAVTSEDLVPESWRARVWRSVRAQPALWVCLGYAIGLALGLAFGR